MIDARLRGSCPPRRFLRRRLPGRVVTAVWFPHAQDVPDVRIVGNVVTADARGQQRSQGQGAAGEVGQIVPQSTAARSFATRDQCLQATFDDVAR